MSVSTTSRSTRGAQTTGRRLRPLVVTSEVHKRLFSAFPVTVNGSWGSPSCFVDHETDVDADTFSVDYLSREFLSKLDDGLPNPEKIETTWKKFHEAELRCSETNHRLATIGFHPDFMPAILLAKEIISRILGRLDLDEVAKGFGWGPGASTRLPRSRSDAAYKFSGKPETTSNNLAYAISAIRFAPLWFREACISAGSTNYLDLVTQVVGNKIITVPKNYKQDRTIAIEPCMNMFVQKGFGAYIRKRLRYAGCDLNDQKRNQRLAHIGSVAGSLATIDLSMASDTVSREIVNHLLPPEWRDALEQCRSQFGVLPSGEKIFYQKFSSMGNGFTFELESLIFYALGLAWCRIHDAETCRVSVYGDDIILPSAVAVSFCGLLLECGFTPNEKKSYWTGPFRESCGKHYFNGQDVTPFYLRRPVASLEDLFLLHNNLYRWAARQSFDTRSAVRPLLSFLRGRAPAAWRKPRILDHWTMDGAFIGSFDEVTPSRARGHIECWEVSVLQRQADETPCELYGLLLKGLYSLERKRRLTDEPFAVQPSQAGRVRTVKVLIPQYCLGKIFRV